MPPPLQQPPILLLLLKATLLKSGSSTHSLRRTLANIAHIICKSTWNKILHEWNQDQSSRNGCVKCTMRYSLRATILWSLSFQKRSTGYFYACCMYVISPVGQDSCSLHSELWWMSGANLSGKFQTWKGTVWLRKGWWKMVGWSVRWFLWLGMWADEEERENQKMIGWHHI